MRDLISKQVVRDIVDNAGYNYGLRDDEPMSSTKFKQLLTEIVYRAVNAIDKEVLRTLSKYSE